MVASPAMPAHWSLVASVAHPDPEKPWDWLCVLAARTHASSDLTATLPALNAP